MPIYDYEGKFYDLETTDKDEAIQKIEAHLGINRSYLSRVGKEALPAVTNYGGDILRSIPSGIRGLGAVASEVAIPQERADGNYRASTWDEAFKAGAESFESNMDTLRKHTPRFRGQRVEDMERTIGEGMGVVAHAGGRVGEEIAMGLKGDFTSPADSPLGYTLGEVATNFLPIPGGALINKGVRKIAPHKFDPKTIREDKLKQLERLQEEVSTARNKRMQTAQQLELFTDEQVHPAKRSPYHIPPDEFMALQDELNSLKSQRVEGEPVVEQRVEGQGELFQPDFAPTMPSIRNRPEVPEVPMLKPGEFISEDGRRLIQEPYDPAISSPLTERGVFPVREPATGIDYTGEPFQPVRPDPNAPNLQPGIPGMPGKTWTQADVGRGKGLAALERRRQMLRTEDMGIPYDGPGALAAAKPGFQRSAEEVMRAREFEKRGDLTALPERERADFDMSKERSAFQDKKQQGSIDVQALRDTVVAMRERAKELMKQVPLTAAGRAEAQRLQLDAARLESQISSDTPRGRQAGGINFGGTKKPKPLTPAEKKAALAALKRWHNYYGVHTNKDPFKGPGKKQAGSIRLEDDDFGRFLNKTLDPSNVDYDLVAKEHAEIKSAANELRNELRVLRNAIRSKEDQITITLRDPHSETYRKYELSSYEFELWEKMLTDHLLDWEIREHELDTLRHELFQKGPGKSQKGAIEFGKKARTSELEQFKKDAKARGIVLPKEVIEGVFEGQKITPEEIVTGHTQENIKSVLDQNPGLKSLKETYVDDRPLSDIKKLLDDPNSKDWSPTGTVRNITGKIINGRFVMQGHPLLSWVSSNVHRIKNRSQEQANQVLHGPRGRAKFPEEGSYNFEWTKLTAKEREEVNRIGWEFNNDERFVTDDMIQSAAMETNGRPLSDTQLRAYKDRVGINKSVLGEFNKYLQDNGREPIPELPNYWSPAEYNGAFLTFFKDKMGETVKVMGTYTRPNIKKLQKEFPDLDINIMERRRNPKVDMEAFIALMRQLGKEQRDPAAQAIGEALRRLGMGRHGLKRKQLEGAMGQKNLREYERVSEEYIRDIYEYMANRDLDKLYNEVSEVTPEGGKHHKARGYSLEAIDVARGGGNAVMEGLSDILSGLVTGTIKFGTAGSIQLPRRFTNDMIKVGNRVGVSLLLGFANFPYITANLFQHIFMRPAMRMHMQKLGMNDLKIEAAMFKAMAEAYDDVVRGATGEHIKDRAELEKIGAIEATFKYDWSNYASESVKDMKNTVGDHLTGISLNAFIEKHAVRKIAGLFTVKLLRELGYDSVAKAPDEIYRVTKELVDKYMVTNRYYEKAHVFSRSSDIGQALSPLQNWATTWLGMLYEYSKHAGTGVTKGKVTHTLPLVEFFAINLMLAGLMGTIGVKEYDAIATKLNEWFGLNMSTATESILKLTEDKSVRYGVLGEGLGKALGFENGLNLGSTFSAPTVTGSYAPGAQFWFNMGNAGYVAAKEAFGKATDVEMREALKGLSPRAGTIPWWNWGDIERRHTPEGVPYERNAGGAAQYKRTEDDWSARKLGTYTLDEAEYKSNTFIADRKADIRSSRFTKTRNLAVDRLLNGDRDISDLVSKMAEAGFTDEEILRGIRTGLRNRLVEPQDKMVGNVTSSRQAMIYQLLRELGEYQ